MPTPNERGYIDGRRTYSQHGQDLFVIDHLNHRAGGFFIEAGAGDGIFLSNTYLLEKDYQWTGILVEPDTKNHEKCLRARECAVENSCLVAQDNGPVKFREDDMMGKIDGNGDKIKSVITLSSLLTKFSAPYRIDYLSLDLEGNETEVLMTFPWDKYTVSIVGIEHNQSYNRYAVQNYLNNYGLIFAGCGDTDDFFVKAGVNR